MRLEDIDHVLGKAEIIMWHLILVFYMLRDFVRKNR